VLRGQATLIRQQIFSEPLGKKRDDCLADERHDELDSLLKPAGEYLEIFGNERYRYQQ
jgi:hypothetical protein